MAAGACFSTVFDRKFFRSEKEELEEADRKLHTSKKFKAVDESRVYDTGGMTTEYITTADLRAKVLTFRDLIDLPPCLGSCSPIELLITTLNDLHKMYPDLLPAYSMSEIEGMPADQALAKFCDAMKAIGEIWMSKDERMEKSKCLTHENMSEKGLKQHAMEILEEMIRISRGRSSDTMDEDESVKLYSEAITNNASQSSSFSENKTLESSPGTPTSVLPETSAVRIFSSRLMPLRVQAVGRLNPIDIRRLSVPLSPQKNTEVYVATDEHDVKKPRIDGGIEYVGRSAMEVDFPVRVSEGPKSTNNSTRGVMDVLLPPPSLGKLRPNAVAPISQPPPPMTRTIKASPPPPTTPPKVDPIITSSLPTPPPPSPRLLISPSNREMPPPPLPPDIASRISMPPSPPPPPNESMIPPPQPPMAPRNAAPMPPPPPPPPGVASNGPVPAPQLPMLPGKEGGPPPPPPPWVASNGPVPVPPPPMLPGKGGGPPPPPPALGGGRLLGPKKATTKLKRSSQLGSLYRLLKVKVEGESLDGKLQRKNSKISGAASGGQQGMADALAEITRRSAYFQQIEEDVKNHAKTIEELKVSISAFQTTDMSELLKFHNHVESHLEKLTDETQVLARFEGFPGKKLEALRMAAALHSKLDATSKTLQNWKIEAPLGQLLDRTENYFNKIKVELDALERTKDEQSKNFQSHKITFDFGILLKIKELMVDVSSSCMELALKEKREAIQGGSKPEGQKKGSAKLLWRAFQFAYKVYTFAGGHDDRADLLTKELAHEIECDPDH